MEAVGRGPEVPLTWLLQVSDATDAAKQDVIPIPSELDAMFLPGSSPMSSLWFH